MASPVWQTMTNDSGTGTGFTMTEPSGAADGNALVAVILIEDTISNLSIPGMTIKGTATGADAGPFRCVHAVLRRAGSPTLTVSWTTSRYWEYSLHRISGIVSSGEFVEAFVEGTPASGTEPNPPAATATTTETLVLISGFTWAGWGGGGAAAPTNYTLRYGPATIDHGVATRALAAAGAEDPGAFTGAGDDSYIACTMILASTGGGGGGGEAPAPQTGLGFTGGMGAGFHRPPRPGKRGLVDFGRRRSGLVVPRRMVETDSVPYIEVAA